MVKFLITALALGLISYVYAKIVLMVDRFEKEPPLFLIGAFVWGAFPAVVFSLFAQYWLNWSLNKNIKPELLIDIFNGNLISVSVNAPITEELFKGMSVAIIYYRHRREFDGWVDGIVYGAMTGFGFAYVENLLYLMNSSNWNDWLIIFVVRIVVFGFMHGFWTALTGIGFGMARYNSDFLTKVIMVILGILSAILFHLIHNAGLVLAEATNGWSEIIVLWNYAFLIGLMIILGYVAGHCDRQKLRLYLYDEVPYALSVNNYRFLCTPKKNYLFSWCFNTKQERDLIQTAAELSQKKYQFETFGEEGGNSKEIEELREKLRKINQELLC